MFLYKGGTLFWNYHLFVVNAGEENCQIREEMCQIIIESNKVDWDHLVSISQHGSTDL